VRTDIPLVNQLVQVGHACLTAGQRFPQPVQPCRMVLLAVDSEAQLMHAVELIEHQGVRLFTFYEPDFPQGYTAACSEPVAGSRKRLFKKFRLWR
jgi:hypothetical protein